jgi:outer membrane biosynthesis protein TonB
MKRFLLVAMLGALAMPLSATMRPPAVEAPVLTTNVEGELGLDPTGAVEYYRVASQVPDAVAAKAQELVRQLRFEPVVVDGQPARARARMRITLAGTPIDRDTFRMRLDGFSFPEEEKPGAPRADGIVLRVDRKRGVSYPEAGARLGVDADVLVAVRIAPDGAIADAAIRQSAILGVGGNPRVVAQLLGQFEQESLRALRAWHVAVHVPDGVQPTAEQMTACVAVRFRMNGHRDERVPGEWQWSVRSQKRDTPWLPTDPARPVAGVADIGGSGLVPAQAGFRLASPLPRAAL